MGCTRGTVSSIALASRQCFWLVHIRDRPVGRRTMGNGASASHLSSSTVVHLPQSAEVTFHDNALPTCVASCSAVGLLLPGDVLLYCGGVPVSSPMQARKLLEARQGIFAPNNRGDGSLRLLVSRRPSTSCILIRESADERFGLCMVTWGTVKAVVGVEVQCTGMVEVVPVPASSQPRPRGQVRVGSSCSRRSSPCVWCFRSQGHGHFTCIRPTR